MKFVWSGIERSICYVPTIFEHLVGDLQVSSSPPSNPLYLENLCENVLCLRVSRKSALETLSLSAPYKFIVEFNVLMSVTNLV